MLTERNKQIMIAEKLRNLSTEVSALIEVRADILPIATEALNSMVLLQDAINKNLPKD
jgi:hypothetical protein